MAAPLIVKAAVLAASALVLAGCTGSSESPDPSESYGPENPMPLDVAGTILKDSCVAELEANAEPGMSFSSVEECIEETGFVLTLLLNEEGVSVVDDQGEPIPAEDTEAAAQERALELWRDEA